MFGRIPALHGYLEDPLLAMVIGGALVGTGIGIIMTFVTSAILKKTFLSGKSLIQMTIMSDKYEEIRQMIIYEVDAGVTMMMLHLLFLIKNFLHLKKKY